MKALIAGFGDGFLGDNAYGREVVRMLSAQEWPDSVRIADFGSRGTDVAFEMLEGYDLVLFVDTIPQGKKPGALAVIEPEALVSAAPESPATDLHSALAFYEGLARDLGSGWRPHILIVACEPASLEEGSGLSAPVAAAVPSTIPLVLKVLAQHGIGVGIYENIA